MTQGAAHGRINIRGESVLVKRGSLVHRDRLHENGVGTTHLPELLIDHTKLERVVDLMFIIRHYHLGCLQEIKIPVVSSAGSKCDGQKTHGEG